MSASFAYIFETCFISIAAHLFILHIIAMQYGVYCILQLTKQIFGIILPTDIGNTRWVILTTSPSWIGWNWNVLVVARLDGKVCVQMWIMSSFILEFDTWIAGSPSNIHTMSMIDRYKSQLKMPKNAAL